MNEDLAQVKHRLGHLGQCRGFLYYGHFRPWNTLLLDQELEFEFFLPQIGQCYNHSNEDLKHLHNHHLQSKVAMLKQKFILTKAVKDELQHHFNCSHASLIIKGKFMSRCSEFHY